jgi:hypothetical protein
MLSLLPLGAAALLASCSDIPRGATPAETARAISAAAAPAAVGTRFDGRYVGPAVLTNSRSNACGAQQQTRSITVVNGNATYIVDQYRNTVADRPSSAGRLRGIGERHQPDLARPRADSGRGVHGSVHQFGLRALAGTASPWGALRRLRTEASQASGRVAPISN